jgi:hypothetical protein
LPVGLEASAKIGDTGVNASPEGVEVVIVSAVQYLLFDKPPQAFDQIKVGRIGRQVKEFDDNNRHPVCSSSSIGPLSISSIKTFHHLAAFVFVLAGMVVFSQLPVRLL